ncbi:unnamed protein product [Toxocara canis]|uniref:Uncharacterized protein n=1 Tax=Toxocara canis TaxID=6265 RepID=A0A183UKT6_TOXCA|nr:unnamed protein product [Toxocara canis]
MKSSRDNDVGREGSMNLITTPPKWYMSDDDLLGQRYEEYVQVPCRRARSRVSWDRIKQIQEIPHTGHQRTYEKRADRSRPNPWRRYGALIKLHEIGGWASKIDRQQSSRRNRKYYYVKPGSRPGIPPTRPPITVRESNFMPASAITVPKCESVEKIASEVGMQFQVLMRSRSQEKLDSSRHVGISLDLEKINLLQNNGSQMEQSSGNQEENSITNKLPTQWSDESGQPTDESNIQVKMFER